MTLVEHRNTPPLQQRHRTVLAAEGDVRPGAAPPVQDGGRSVFLSYNRENSREAMRLRDALRDEGLDVFMDNVHLLAGQLWLNRLKQAVAQARAIVVLMRKEGPRGFVLDEIGWALERQRRAAADGQAPAGLFPVAIGEVPDTLGLDPRVRELLDYQVTIWQPDQPLPAGLLAQLRATLPLALFEKQRCPFRGLAAFEEADAAWFFGRMREIHEVIDAMGSSPAHDGLIDRESPSHHRYVLISGESGSGKSSLMRAGALPLLRQGALWPRTGLARWQIVGPLRPGAHPVRELARALTALAAPDRRDADALGAQLLADKQALTRLVAAQGDHGGLLLVIDQMEELLQNAAEGRERQQFGALLAAALDEPSCRLYVIGTVRADALAELDTLLPALVQARNRVGTTYTLPRISDSGLRLSIEEPARRAGIDVAEVAELILAEARSEPGALALVQHAMWSLWRAAHRRGPVKRLLRSDHEAGGGLAGLLSRDADAALADVEAAIGSDAPALRLLLRMTWVDAEERLFRRRLGRDEAETVAGQGDRQRGERVIELLSPQHGNGAGGDDAPAHLPLVVTGHDDAGGGYVELVHEMLLRTRNRPGEAAVPHWKRLYDHIKAHLQELTLMQRLHGDVQSWRRFGPWQRWRRLAGIKEQRLYARLPRAADPQVRLYLALSHAKSASLAAAVVLPLAWLGVGSWFVYQQRDIFPINYAVRLPLWLIGRGATPDFVRLPGDVANFDFGCDPSRDGVGGKGCDDLLPLRRAFSQPIACDMGRHEVTFEQYDRFVFSEQRAGNKARTYPSPDQNVRGNLPVMGVSRADAEAYARWLGEHSGGRQTYRLPKEWEWEYAARAGSSGPYPWGIAAPEGKANHDPGGPAKPAAAWPVHRGQANAFGLVNVVGNASEWVADDADPAAPSAPGYVLRGGSLAQGPVAIRVAHRQVLATDFVADGVTPSNFGFRLCRQR